MSKSKLKATQLAIVDGNNEYIVHEFEKQGLVVKTKEQLKSAISKLSLSEGTIIVVDNIIIDEDITVPENVMLKFFKGGKLTVNTASTLTINSGIEAGLFQIFDGDGTVTGNPKIEAVYPEWFGAKGDGTTDDTDTIQKAVDFVQSGAHVELNIGVYKISTVYIDKPIIFKGKANKHHTNIDIDPTVGITLSDLPKTTIILQTSTTSPCLSLKADTRLSGLVIDGIVFYQDHADYSNPTPYPYTISDKDSISYWSGLIIRNCMFINCYKGISLTHCERFDIYDINGDFLYQGIYTANIHDVSKMERIHIWNFSKSTAASNFKQSNNSDYAIYLDNIDEVYIRDIFIWDRYKGIYCNKVWGTLENITLDTVGKFVINNPKHFGFILRNIKINNENDVEIIDGALHITGDTIIDLVTVIIDGIEVWKGANRTYTYNSAILIDYAYAYVFLNNVHIKHAISEGVKILNAKEVLINGIKFSSDLPNQVAYTLKTVGIRNESQDAIVSIKNFSINYDILKYVYDGYYDNLVLEKKPSLTLCRPYLQVQAGYGTAAPSEDDYGVYFEYTDTDTTSAWHGMRQFPTYNDKYINGKVYLLGVVYQNTTTIASNISNTDTRYISFCDTGSLGVDFFVPLRTELSSARRLVIMARKANISATPQVSAYARGFSGTIRVYKLFVVESLNLVEGVDENGVYYSTSTPTSGYWKVGDKIYNPAPTVDANNMILLGWVCVASGYAGTWKPMYVSVVSPAV